MTDHVTKAEKLLDRADHLSFESQIRANLLAEAQVHATLALNDTLMWNQQRTEEVIGVNIGAIEINTRRR